MHVTDFIKNDWNLQSGKTPKVTFAAQEERIRNLFSDYHWGMIKVWTPRQYNNKLFPPIQ